MQIRYGLKGVRGYRRLKRIYYNSCMISKEAKRRKKIFDFWQKYGLEATKEAFGVSRCTLYQWKAKLKEAKGDMSALNPKSNRPKSVRQSKFPAEIVKEIRRLREEYPNIGKAKLYYLLKPFVKRTNFLFLQSPSLGE